MSARSLDESWIHLGLGASATAQPEFTGMDWYEDYAARTVADGTQGRLVSAYRFTKDWDSWEMHPHGDEVVICTAGEFVLVQESNGETARTRLRKGEYAINPAGVWHTADITHDAEAIFITAGLDTQHRPR